MLSFYEASVRGEMGDTLCAAFADCEVVPAHGTTAVRFQQEQLQEVLDRIQDFGLDLIGLCLRGESAPGARQE